MEEIYYIKVKVLSLIIYFSDKLITGNGMTFKIRHPSEKFETPALFLISMQVT